MPAPCVVVAWTEEGTEPTGRTVLRDGYHRAELRRCRVPRACVWSRDMADLPAGQAYARREGYRCMVLPDTGDVLAVARDAVLRHEAGAR